MKSIQLHPSFFGRIRLLATSCLVAVMMEACGEVKDEEKPILKIISELDPARSETDKARGAESLRHLGTNALPLLLAEMNSFKWHTPEEKDERIISRTRELREAFQVLGTNLAPLLGEFVSDLNTNRNFVSALDGISAIGPQGVPFLIAAMTNHESAVRLNAVAAVMKLGTNFGFAKLAVPNLMLLLNDQSPLIRSITCETVGLYCNEPSIAISILLKLARDDPDAVIRSQGIKAIWRINTRLGGVDSTTKAVVAQISNQDSSHAVRACAERFLAGKQP